MYCAMFQHRKGMDGAAQPHQAHAIGFARPAPYRAQRGKRTAPGIEPVQAQARLRLVIAVRCDDNHAVPAHVQQIDVVEPPRRLEMADLPDRHIAEPRC